MIYGNKYAEIIRPHLVQVKGSGYFGKMAAQRKRKRVCTAQDRSGPSCPQGVQEVTSIDALDSTEDMITSRL